MLGALSTVGLSFVLALVIGVAGGVWLDRTAGTSPWGFLGGFALGRGGRGPQRLPGDPAVRAVMADADPLIRRLQRDARDLVRPGHGGRRWPSARTRRPSPAGVAGGGLLALVSLFAIRSSVDALLVGRLPGPSSALPTPRRTARPRAVRRATDRAAAGVGVKLAGRYALSRPRGVRYDCAFAPAPRGRADWRLVARRRRLHRSGRASCGAP